MKFTVYFRAVQNTSREIEADTAEEAVSKAFDMSLKLEVYANPTSVELGPNDVEMPMSGYHEIVGRCMDCSAVILYGLPVSDGRTYNYSCNDDGYMCYWCTEKYKNDPR